MTSHQQALVQRTKLHRVCEKPHTSSLAGAGHALIQWVLKRRQLLQFVQQNQVISGLMAMRNGKREAVQPPVAVVECGLLQCSSKPKPVAA